MINSKNGLNGRSVLTYARETLGRRMAQNQTQDEILSEDLRPAAMLHMHGELSDEARAKVRKAYTESLSGAGRLAIIDQKVEKFETVQINPVDAQFLELIGATDIDICNFFSMPAHKVNMGKQTYESNEQQNLDYLSTTIDPYLVAWEQAAQLQWLSSLEQSYSYWRFERNAILRTDAKTRGETLKNAIMSGRMTPNQANQVEDMPSYDGGNRHYIPSNMAAIEEDGTITVLSAPQTGAGESQNVEKE